MKKVFFTLNLLFIAGLIFIFSAAAFTKFTDLPSYYKEVSEMGFLPTWMRSVGLFVVPGLELAVAFYLLKGQWRKEACLLAVLLLTFFMVPAVHAGVTGAKEKSCGCMKIAGSPFLNFTGWKAVGRNLVFISFAAYVYGYSVSRTKREKVSETAIKESAQSMPAASPELARS